MLPIFVALLVGTAAAGVSGSFVLMLAGCLACGICWRIHTLRRAASDPVMGSAGKPFLAVLLWPLPWLLACLSYSRKSKKPGRFYVTGPCGDSLASFKPVAEYPLLSEAMRFAQYRASAYGGEVVVTDGTTGKQYTIEPAQ